MSRYIPFLQSHAKREKARCVETIKTENNRVLKLSFIKQLTPSI